jgi:AcrR family transcriptional regulator/DNA-binding transcriptional MerR regulator
MRSSDRRGGAALRGRRAHSALPASPRGAPIAPTGAGDDTTHPNDSRVRKATTFGRTGVLDLSDLVIRTGVPAATLHHWLRLGLLPPAKRVSSNRFAYDDQHVQAGRLVRMLRARRRMSLRDIAAILPALLAAPEQDAFRPETWDTVIAEQRLDEHDQTPPPFLVDTVRDTFSRHGYASVSVDELCAAAGIAKGSFYRWFSSKDDAYAEAVRSVGVHIEDELAQRPVGSGLAAADEAFGEAASPYLALLLEAVSRTMQGDAGVGAALNDCLAMMERAFLRLAGSRPGPARRRLQDVLARSVSAVIVANT